MRGVSGDDHSESSVGSPSGGHQHPAVIVDGQCTETLVAKKRRADYQTSTISVGAHNVVLIGAGVEAISSST